jgi:hypothetical protein
VKGLHRCMLNKGCIEMCGGSGGGVSVACVHLVAGQNDSQGGEDHPLRNYCPPETH